VAAPPGLRRVEQIMGMPIVVDLRDEGLHEGSDELAELVFDWLREVDERFSTYKATSEISRLNGGELLLADCHADVRAVLARCDELREATDGYFDARYASLETVDPSGLVKGWSIDRAAELLDARGARNYSLNAAGDIRMRGAPLPGARWRVGIQHPLLRDRVAAVVEANDLALATSGAYARGAHIVDPHSGRPADGVDSVTVVGPELATADAYATAAFAMGEAAPAWTATLAPYEALTVLPDQTFLATPGFPLLRDGD
jgi:thiamine biosynthesis lipoprotein